MLSFELDKEIEKNDFRLVTSVWQRNNSESPWGIEPQTFGARNPKVWDSIPYLDSELFLCPTLVTRRKKFLIVKQILLVQDHFLRQRAKAKNISFINSLWWPIYIINSVHKTKFYCNTHTDAAPQFFRNLHPFCNYTCQFHEINTYHDMELWWKNFLFLQISLNDLNGNMWIFLGNRWLTVHKNNNTF